MRLFWLPLIQDFHTYNSCNTYKPRLGLKALVEGTLDPAYGSIVKSTRLLVFFATPHLGGNYSGIGDIAAKIVRTGLGTPSNDLLDGLKAGSRDVIRRFEQARHLPANCLVISFYETENYGRFGLVCLHMSFSCLFQQFWH